MKRDPFIAALARYLEACDEYSITGTVESQRAHKKLGKRVRAWLSSMPGARRELTAAARKAYRRSEYLRVQNRNQRRAERMERLGAALFAVPPSTPEGLRRAAELLIARTHADDKGMNRWARGLAAGVLRVIEMKPTVRKKQP